MSANAPLLGETLDAWLDRLDADGFKIGVRQRLVVHEFLARLAASGEMPLSEFDALALLAPLVCASPHHQGRYGVLLKEFLDVKSRVGLPQSTSGAATVVAENARRSRRAVWAGGVVLLLILGMFLALHSRKKTFDVGKSNPLPEPTILYTNLLGFTNIVVPAGNQIQVDSSEGQVSVRSAGSSNWVALESQFWTPLKLPVSLRTETNGWALLRYPDQTVLRLIPLSMLTLPLPETPGASPEIQFVRPPVVGDFPRPIYVPIHPLVLNQTTPMFGGKLLRVVAWLIAALSLVLLGYMVWTRYRRALYLHGTRTDRKVEDQVLYDPDAAPVVPTVPQLRAASVGLRQRIAGQRRELNLPLTRAATIRAAGAFNPRFRFSRTTPEYLALIDRRHPGDHFSAYGSGMVQALTQYSVAAQVFYFDGSPAAGCWRLRAGATGEEPFDKCSLAELAARYHGHRLLVFAEASILMDPLSGAPRAWARRLTEFPDRSWLTPLPPASWGAAEHAADALGFLVLPAQFESLATLAGWLSSESLSLEAQPDWPFNYPDLLRDDAIAWVARQSAPPAESLGELLFQLRSWLGPLRFQWLCACAIFPSLSPPLTAALGRELTADPRELAVGLASLGALPWFRHGSVPDWLRQALIERLSPDNERRYRAVIERRLGAALTDAPGPELFRVAMPRRLAAWLRRGRGPARDVVMVDFLRRDALTRLAQKLPETLRRRLFRKGRAAYGLRPAFAVGTASLLCALALFPFALRRLAASREKPVPALAQIDAPLDCRCGPVEAVAFSPDGRRIVSGDTNTTLSLWDADTGIPIGGPLTGHSNAVLSVAFSPDGLWIVSGSRDNTLRVWDARTGKSVGRPLIGHSNYVAAVAFSPDGRSIVSASADGTLRLWDASNGNQIGAPLTGHSDTVYCVAFSPDGRRIVSGSFDHTLRLWDAVTGRQIGAPLVGHSNIVSAVVFSPGGVLIASASHDNTLRLWDTDTASQVGAPLLRTKSGFDDVAFSRDGRQMVSANGDGTLCLWDVISRQQIGNPIFGHSDWVTSVVFSPDGRRVASGASDGTVRRWGMPALPRIDLLGCSDPRGVDPAARSVADECAKFKPSDFGFSAKVQGFDVVAYAPDTWADLNDGSAPAPGEILYYAKNAERQRLAESLRQWLQTHLGINRANPWTLRAVTNDSGSVVVNLCDHGEPKPSPTPINPDFATKAAINGLKLDPGYSWDTNAVPKRAVWTPGLVNLQYPHLAAAAKEGFWQPDPGYVFVRPDQGLETRWVPGVRHPVWPHIYASTIENQWLPDSGYRFADSGQSLEVVSTGAQPGPGWVEIISEPAGAKFSAKTVAGTIPDGRTPATLPVKPGSVVYQFSLDGYYPTNLTVQVVAGQTNHISFALIPLPSAGWVEINCLPPDARIDGDPIPAGPTQMAYTKVVEFTRDGYYPTNVTVVVVAGKTNRVSLTMTKMPGRANAPNQQLPSPTKSAPDSPGISTNDNRSTASFPLEGTILKGIVIISSSKDFKPAGVVGIDGVQVRGPLFLVPQAKALGKELAPYLGRPFELSAFINMEKAVISFCSKYDHPVVDIYFPEQEIINGTLQLFVYPGTVGKMSVVFDAPHQTSEAQVLKVIQLKSGDEITQSRLQKEGARLKKAFAGWEVSVDVAHSNIAGLNVNPVDETPPAVNLQFNFKSVSAAHQKAK